MFETFNSEYDLERTPLVKAKIAIVVETIASTQII